MGSLELERSRQPPPPRYVQQSYESGYRRRPQSPYGQGFQGYYSPPSVNTSPVSPVAGWHLVQQNTSQPVRYPPYYNNYNVDSTTSDPEVMSDWEMIGTDV